MKQFILMLFLCAFAQTAWAGCKINYSFHNNSSAEMIATNQQVKSKGGTWTELLQNTPGIYKVHKAIFKVIRGRTGWDPIKLRPGGKLSGIYSASFSCKAKRRYRYVVSDGSGCRKNIYYPSATGWTKSTNINFGDISRYCK